MFRTSLGVGCLVVCCLGCGSIPKPGSVAGKGDKPFSVEGQKASRGLDAQRNPAGSDTARAQADGTHLPRDTPQVARNLQAGEQAEQMGQMQIARSAYEQVLAAVPNHPVAHHRLATIADREKQYKEAESHYKEALQVTPRNADLLSDLGYSYLLQDRDKEAEKMLREALRSNPQHQYALTNLGSLYEKHGRMDDAQMLYARAGRGSSPQQDSAPQRQMTSAPAGSQVWDNMAQNAAQDPNHQPAQGGPGDRSNPSGVQLTSATSGASLQPTEEHPNAATKKLAEEYQRRRREYDQQQARQRAQHQQRHDQAAARQAAANPPSAPGNRPAAPQDYNQLFDEIDRQYEQSFSQANQPRRAAPMNAVTTPVGDDAIAAGYRSAAAPDPRMIGSRPPGPPPYDPRTANDPRTGSQTAYRPESPADNFSAQSAPDYQPAAAPPANLQSAGSGPNPQPVGPNSAQMPYDPRSSLPPSGSPQRPLPPTASASSGYTDSSFGGAGDSANLPAHAASPMNGQPPTSLPTTRAAQLGLNAGAGVLSFEDEPDLPPQAASPRAFPAQSGQPISQAAAGVPAYSTPAPGTPAQAAPSQPMSNSGMNPHTVREAAGQRSAPADPNADPYVGGSTVPYGTGDFASPDDLAELQRIEQEEALLRQRQQELRMRLQRQQQQMQIRPASPNASR